MTPPIRRPLRRAEALGLAAALTILAITLPSSGYVDLLFEEYFQSVRGLKGHYHRFADLCLILVGLILTLPAPRESGLRIGNIRKHWKGVLFLTGGPVLLCAIVYPNLPQRPFHKMDLSIWLTSPLAQDLIFGGVIYRLLRPHFSGFIHRRVPMEWALPVGGLFFASWHVQNFASFPAAYVVFQLVYTWSAFTFVGLTRQWTGSILYVDLAHMAGNFVPWYVGNYVDGVGSNVVG
jgi:membrane protease YdiL (CAAX protease family)